MNLHLAQNLESMAELRMLAAVPMQIVSPQASKPSMGMVQDSLLGSYMITKNTKLSLKDFMTLIPWIITREESIPRPLLGAERSWSGQQFMSMYLPLINYVKGGIRIKLGQFKPNGLLDKSSLGAKGGSLFHVAWNDYGPQIARDLMDNVSRSAVHWLMINGFSVGFKDCVPKANLLNQVADTIQEYKEQAVKKIERISLGLSESGVDPQTAKELFDGKMIEILNKCRDQNEQNTQKSLDPQNSINTMVTAGSKGSKVNLVQIMAQLGQQELEGTRIPDYFTRRPLPHFHKDDLTPEARGFVEASFYTGLNPAEYWFHAQAGRIGVVSKAIKSVTGDTPIIIMEDDKIKYVNIGDWIDQKLYDYAEKVEHYTEKEMELLKLDNDIYIPTTNHLGQMSWGKITDITRHDPGNELYKIITKGGRDVIVTESKSLLIWRNGRFQQIYTPDVKIGDYAPTTETLPEPPIINKYIDMCQYFSKDSFGKGIPEKILLNRTNGRFIGLFLAKGNAYTRLGYTNITSIDPNIQLFVKQWFSDMNIKYFEINKVGGKSSTIRGYSKLLADFLTYFVGHKAINKFVPNEAFNAPLEFIIGLIDGYISADGCIAHNSIQVSSASKRLLIGINLLLSRLGIYTKLSKTISKKNTLAIRGKWAKIFAQKISLICNEKQKKLEKLRDRQVLRNCDPRVEGQVILDKIVSIEKIDISNYPKVYDLTIPSTLNFGLANGLQVADTAETGYLQRKLIKALEDLRIDYDGTVRNATGMIIQSVYGNDGFDPSFHEQQKLPFISYSRARLEQEFRFLEHGDTFQNYLTPNAWQAFQAHDATTRTTLINQEFEQIITYQDFLRHQVLKGQEIPEKISCPINFRRLVDTVASQFELPESRSGTELADIDPIHIIEQVQDLRSKLIVTQNAQNNYVATILLNSLLATHLSVKNLIVRYHFHKIAFDHLIKTIYSMFLRSLINSGEMVGLIAAQSIGEPTSQSTLNQFHSTGLGSKANVSRGVPRIKELLSLSKDPKTPSLTIYVKEDLFTQSTVPEISDADARRNANIERTNQLRAEIEYTILADLVSKIEIHYDPAGDTETCVLEDREFIEWYYQLLPAIDPESELTQNPWLLRLEFDRETIFNKNLLMSQIESHLRQFLADHAVIHTVIVSDDNAHKLICRIRIGNLFGYPDPVSYLRSLESNLMMLKIHGISGIDQGYVRALKKDIILKDGTILSPYDAQYQATVQKDSIDNVHYLIDTNGSNLLEVLNHPMIDPYLTISNNVIEIYHLFGIEAARSCLIHEINDVLEYSGTVINLRHIELLVDSMVNQGILISVDRHGLSKTESGPLHRASFEETTAQLTKASIYSEIDRMKGVSSNIMFGQFIPVGTNSFKIGLDLEKIKTQEIPIQPTVQVNKKIEVLDISQVAELCAPENFEFTFKLNRFNIG